MTIEIVGILSIPKDNKLIDTIENRTAVICVLFKYSLKKNIPNTTDIKGKMK